MTVAYTILGDEPYSATITVFSQTDLNDFFRKADDGVITIESVRPLHDDEF